ncbi:MAG: D-2-hydroxyacid dehydrogenase [Candidatus Limivicinus sp.]|jgi:phosphoglycerate dehydrogenase-like enzyme
MKNILCLLPVEQRHKDRLEEAAPGCRFVYGTVETATEEQVAEANIILGRVKPGLIKQSENLELLQLNSAGADPYCDPGILNKKTRLTNSTGAYSKAVSEHAFACLLMIQKNLHLYRDAQKKRAWDSLGNVTSIADSTVLVVGLGDIGRHFAALAKALGAYVIGVKRRESAKPDCVDELYTTDKLESLLGRADVIFSVLPGTKESYHIYTPELFDRMKKSAIFINCGRGGAVATDVLYDALSTGKIAAAAVDVTEPEPLPEDDPLWTLDNIVITPHVSGFYHLPETFERVVDIACENLTRFLSGRELINVVDLSMGYKK